MAWWRRHDHGSTSAVGLSVSAATFAIAFVTANLMVTQPSLSDGRATQLDLSAQVALDVAVSQGGRGPGGASWALTPDLMTRFGLADDATQNFLDYRKIKAMRNGSMETASNGAPDYADVRNSLAITEGDFHLRTYPVLPDLSDPRWSKDPRGRVGYVGHYDTPSGVATATAYANASSTLLNVSVAIRNDGFAAHIFVVNVGIGNLASSNVIETEQRHTRLLAPGEVQTVWADFPKMAYSPSLTGVRIDLADGYGNEALAPWWIPASAPTGGSNVNYGVLVSAGQVYYQTGTTVKFQADHFEGDGTRMNSHQSGRFVLVGHNGKEWVNQSVTLPKNGVYTHSCTNCTTAGIYTATIWDSGVTRKARDIVHVSATPLFQESSGLDLVALREIAILQSLVEGFNGLEYSASTQPEGDVFSDDSNGPHELVDVLSRYSTLVVGSEVKQNALNAGPTKWGIADWVQNGGNLVVLGTLDSQSHWLEPVYHASQRTASGGISAPDPTHPVLKAPNRIDHDRYLDNGRAWRIKDDQPFTHILTRGSSGGSSEDTLAIANPGAYNEGTVVLTSYMVGALTSPQDDDEARRFMHNLLSQSYTMLFLDFGPPIPDGVTIGSAQRLVAVPHPNVPNAVVEVRIVMYRW